MRRFVNLGLVVAAACGSDPIKAGDASPDALEGSVDDVVVVDGDSDSDSPSTAPRCDPLKAFGLPQALSLSIDTVWSPRLSGDGLRLYYLENYTYLRMAERPSLDAGWAAPTTLMMLIAGLALSSDELRLYTSNGNGIVLFERANRMLPWPVSGVPVTIGFQGALNLSYDGNTMYGSMPIAQQGNDLVGADAIDKQTFKAPTPLGNTNYTSDESYPVPSSDGNTVYFASNRFGGPGQLDVHVSIRANSSAPWSYPLIVSTLNSPNDDIPGAVSPDGCEMFMTVNFKLSVARKPKQ